MSRGTPFAAMPAPQLDRWIAWAADHNWGADFDPYFDGEKLHVAGLLGSVDDRGQRSYETEYFAASSPQELRDWAGY
jgi:L-rhamnose isomerase